VPVGALAGEGIDAVKVMGFEMKAGFGDAVSPTAGVEGTTVSVTVAVAGM
jgi:hypothetical protein